MQTKETNYLQEVVKPAAKFIYNMQTGTPKGFPLLLPFPCWFIHGLFKRKVIVFNILNANKVKLCCP